jgi:hypothetical protein
MGMHKKFSDSMLHGALICAAQNPERAAALLGCHQRTVQRYLRRQARIRYAALVAKRKEFVRGLQKARHSAAATTVQEDIK